MKQCNTLKRILSILAILTIFQPTNTVAYYSDQYLDAKIKSIMQLDNERENSAAYKNQPTEKQKFLCVSLGFNCFPALNLDHAKLRQHAFPFDWNLTPLRSLCNILENDFLDFLNPAYLNISTNSFLGIRSPGVFNTKCNIAFAHDWPEKYPMVSNWLDYLPEITEKYQRRIERFNSVCELADTVYFFRSKSAYWIFDNQPEDTTAIIKLRDTLRKKFPKNNWVLIALDDSAEYTQDWAIPQIKNFCIHADSQTEWTNVFRKLGLIT